MRFHIDTDIGSEISLWVAPDHPDRVPRVSVWDGQHHIITMDANILRDDVRQLGMHSTGQVGFSITSDTIVDLERIPELMIIIEEEETDKEQKLLVYRRTGKLLNHGQRLLIFDTGTNRVGPSWNATLTQYALHYPNLETLNLETLLSVLGNKLAPSIGAVGFPYLSRVQSILDSLDYRIIMMFRDPVIQLAHQIDHIATQDSLSSNIEEKMRGILNRRALISMLRNISETEMFELSNPVTRRLLKAPGEKVSSKDVTNALRKVAQFDLVATDLTRDMLNSRGEGNLIPLPSAPAITERQGQLAEHLRHIGIATDMIAEDLALYDLTSAAITRACERPEASLGKKEYI